MKIIRQHTNILENGSQSHGGRQPGNLPRRVNSSGIRFVWHLHPLVPAIPAPLGARLSSLVMIIGENQRKDGDSAFLES